MSEQSPSAAAAGKPKPAAAPARELPSQEQIADWAKGAELPTLAALFDQLATAKFDTLTMQIKKEELLPQHWQVISRREIDDASAFDGYGEIERLRRRHADPALAARRIEALRVGWRELGGKQPALWTAADLFAALRRIIDQKLAVDFHDLLSGARDVWSGLTLPHGREQLEVLWACLAFVREKIKK